MMDSNHGNLGGETVSGLRKELHSAWAHYERSDELIASAQGALEGELMPGEDVLVVIPGMANSAIIGTDRRLFVIKTGFRPHGGGPITVSSWDYRSIIEVQLDVGPMSGAVVVRPEPGPAADASARSNDAWKAPNAIAINGAQFELAREGVASLQKLSASARPS